MCFVSPSIVVLAADQLWLSWWISVQRDRGQCNWLWHAGQQAQEDKGGPLVPLLKLLVLGAAVAGGAMAVKRNKDKKK